MFNGSLANILAIWDVFAPPCGRYLRAIQALLGLCLSHLRRGITLGPPEGIFETPEVVLGGIFGPPRSELNGQLGVILNLLG